MKLARVTTNAGTPMIATQNPCQTPRSSPVTRPISKAIGVGTWKLMTASEVMTAHMMIEAPSERSMCPGTITITMPAHRIAVVATWRLRLVRFRGDRKRPWVRTWKMMATISRIPTNAKDRICAVS